MTDEQSGRDHEWWPRIKDWLAIVFVIVVVILVGWMFVLEGIHH